MSSPTRPVARRGGTSTGRTLSIMLWLGALLGALAGGLMVVAALVGSSAPQQGAGAAIGCGLAVVPYVVARAFDEMRRGE